MKRLKRIFKGKRLSQLAGIGIGVVAIYFSVKNINSDELRYSIASMHAWFLIPIIVVNFVVTAFKAWRWQLMVRPIKRVGFIKIYKILTIGFMANNILPARLGEVLRIHLLGKDAEISFVSTTASLVADRMLEAISFLMIAALLILFSDVPKWLHYGLTITLLITVIAYTLALIYSGRNLKNGFLTRFQGGIRALSHWKIFSAGLLASFVSWFLQLVMVYMTQLAFNVHLPIWGTLLVIISVNMAIAAPGAPAHLGTFEFACVLAYAYLGVDKSLGLLIGATYHLLQVIPTTIAGGLIMLFNQIKAFAPSVSTQGQDTTG